MSTAGGREVQSGHTHSNYLVTTPARAVYWNSNLRVVYFVSYSNAITTDYDGYEYSNLESSIGHAKRT